MLHRQVKVEEVLRVGRVEGEKSNLRQTLKPSDQTET